LIRDRALRCGGAGGTRRNRITAFFQGLLQLLPTSFRKEKGWIDQFQSLQSGERIGAFTREHHMRGFFHDGARQRNRMTNLSDAGDGSSVERGSIHERCVEFVAPGRGEHGTASGVEQRIIFHEPDRGFDGIQGRPTAGKHFGSRLERRGERRTICGFAFRSH
jgi:hypothetical protein